MGEKMRIQPNLRKKLKKIEIGRDIRPTVILLILFSENLRRHKESQNCCLSEISLRICRPSRKLNTWGPEGQLGWKKKKRSLPQIPMNDVSLTHLRKISSAAEFLDHLPTTFYYNGLHSSLFQVRWGAVGNDGVDGELEDLWLTLEQPLDDVVYVDLPLSHLRPPLFWFPGGWWWCRTARQGPPSSGEGEWTHLRLVELDPCALIGRSQSRLQLAKESSRAFGSSSHNTFAIGR